LPVLTQPRTRWFGNISACWRWIMSSWSFTDEALSVAGRNWR